MNHYIALVNAAGTPVVTLPHGTEVSNHGVISGLTGAMAMWNGTPPPWCWEIVEVRSKHGWHAVPAADKTCLWRRI